MKNYLASLVLAVCLLTGPVASQSATVSINIGGTFLCMNMWLLHFADARKCYICGEGADGPFRTLPTHHGQSSVPTVEGTCEGFRPEEKYAFDCPPSYTSCLTQVDGEIEIRTCGESLAINDCKSANSIDYCYCSTDLCNQLTRTEIRRSIDTALMHAHNRNRLGGIGMHHHHPPPNNSDDEDMAESSGMDGDRSESHRTMSSSRSSTQQHHRDMLHNGVAGDGGSIVAPGNRDVTTQITITLKPVATSTDRRSKDNSASSDSNTTAHHDRSRDSNAIPSTSSSSLRVGPGPLIVLLLVLAALKHVPY